MHRVFKSKFQRSVWCTDECTEFRNIFCSSGFSCGRDPQGAPGFQEQVSTFRVLSALQDFLAVGTLRVHRVFKSKFHFPTGSGMPLDSIRDASAVVEMVCSCRANPVRRHWSVGASASSFFVQGSPRSQTAVCRGICFSTF